MMTFAQCNNHGWLAQKMYTYKESLGLCVVQ